MTRGVSIIIIITTILIPSSWAVALRSERCLKKPKWPVKAESFSCPFHGLYRNLCKQPIQVSVDVYQYRLLRSELNCQRFNSHRNSYVSLFHVSSKTFLNTHTRAHKWETRASLLLLSQYHLSADTSSLRPPPSICHLFIWRWTQGASVAAAVAVGQRGTFSLRIFVQTYVTIREPRT